MGSAKYNPNAKYEPLEVKNAIATAFPEERDASDFLYRLLCYAYGTDRYINWGVQIMARRPAWPDPHAAAAVTLHRRMFPS